MAKTYDPKKIILTFRGILVRGYAGGTFINVNREADGFTKSVGASGDVTRVRSNDRSGTVAVTLQAESPANDALSAVAIADELTGDQTGALLLKDLNGTTLIRAEAAWIRKFPEFEYADEGGNREWMFDCAELEMLVGGNTT